MNTAAILEAFGVETGTLEGPEFEAYRRAREEADAAQAAFVATLQERADRVAALLESDLRRMGALGENDHIKLSVSVDG